MEQSEGIQDFLLRTGYAAHPVVTTDPVETDGEIRPDMPTLQLVKQAFINQCAVRVDLTDRNMSLQKGVDNLQEIRSHEWFSAGQRNAINACLGQLLDDVQALLAGKFAVLGLRGRHVAVTAAVVAPPGDGPVCPRYVTAGEPPVLLTVQESGSPLTLFDEAVFVELRDDLPVNWKQNGAGGSRNAVAKRKGLKSRLIEEQTSSAASVNQRVWQAFPTAQQKKLFQEVRHIPDPPGFPRMPRSTDLGIP